MLLPVTVGAIFWFPLWLFLGLIDLVLVLSLVELQSILSHYGMSRLWLTTPLTLLFPWVWTFQPDSLLQFVLLCNLIILASTVFETRNVERGLLTASGNLLAFLYLGVPLSLAVILRNRSAAELLLVLVCIWAGDTAAYLVGRRWGRKHIAPAISPGKTLEGFLAGMVAATGAAILYGRRFCPDFSLSFLATAGFIIGLSGIVGDLFESLLKRGAQIKDSSNLIPGHGGVLDRIDSLMFALPFYYLLSVLLK